MNTTPRAVSLLRTASLIASFSTAAYAQTQVNWNGSVSSDWNTGANWNGGVVPTKTPGNQHAVVNTSTGNIATITSDITPPVDIFVGLGTGNTGRLDHTAGHVSTGDGNWMFVGRGGGNGTYNLADVSSSGGLHTGFGTGTGSLNVAGRLYIGGMDGSGNIGVANINTTGNINVGSQLQIGNTNSTGTLNLDGGNIITAGGWVEVGNGTGGTGTLNMSGGSLTKNGGDHFIIGANGATGYANISGGALTVNNEIWVSNNGGTGTLQFSGGTISNSSWVAIGRSNGSGTVNMTGGTWTKNGGGNFIVAASGPATMVQSGGLVDVQTGITWIGEQNNATGNFTLSDTAEFRTSQLVIAVQGGTTGNVNLNGGTLRTGLIEGQNGTANVAFNGTQIIATGSDANFIRGLDTAVIQGGGLRVDTNGNSVGTSQQFTGSGGIVKSGAGTFTIDGTQGYTGSTEISAGTLALTAGASIGASDHIHIASGATLDVSAISGWTLGSGQILSGNGSIAGLNELQFSANSTLSFSMTNTLSLLSGTVTFEPGFGVANLSGLDSATPNGLYTLIAGDVDTTGLLNLGSGNAYDLGNGRAAYFQSGSLQLVVVPEPSAATLFALGALSLVTLRRRVKS